VEIVFETETPEGIVVVLPALVYAKVLVEHSAVADLEGGSAGATAQCLSPGGPCDSRAGTITRASFAPVLRAQRTQALPSCASRLCRGAVMRSVGRVAQAVPFPGALVDHAAAFAPPGHQPSSPQHAEMLADPGRAEGQLAREVERCGRPTERE
jgi:hypothetical protein